MEFKKKIVQEMDKRTINVQSSVNFLPMKSRKMH